MSTKQAAWAACSAQSGVLLNSPLAHSGQSKKKLSIPIQHKAGSKKKDLQLHPCNTLQGIQIPSKHSAAIGVETYQHIQQGLLNPSTYSAGCLTQGTMLDILLSRVRKPSNTSYVCRVPKPFNTHHSMHVLHTSKSPPCPSVIARCKQTLHHMTWHILKKTLQLTQRNQSAYMLISLQCSPGY